METSQALRAKISGEVAKLLADNGFAPEWTSVSAFGSRNGTTFAAEFAAADVAERCATWLRSIGMTAEVEPGDSDVGPMVRFYAAA